MRRPRNLRTPKPIGFLVLGRRMVRTPGGYRLQQQEVHVTRFAVSRIWQGGIVIGGVTTIVFSLTRVVGDPVQALLPIEASAMERIAAERRLGLDQPLLEQFVHFVSVTTSLHYLTSTFTGDDTCRQQMREHLWALSCVQEELAPLTAAA